MENNQIMDDVKFKVDTKFVDDFSKEEKQKTIETLEEKGIISHQDAELMKLQLTRDRVNAEISEEQRKAQEVVREEGFCVVRCIWCHDIVVRFLLCASRLSEPVIVHLSESVGAY